MADYPTEVWDPYDQSYPYRNQDGSTQVNTTYMNARDNETVAIEAVLGANLAPVPGSQGARPLSDRLKVVTDSTLQVGRITDFDPEEDAGVQIRIGPDDCSSSWLDVRKPSSVGPMEIQANYHDSGKVLYPTDLALQPDGGNLGVGTNAPLGKAHVQSSLVSRGSVSADADDLVVESSGNTGVTLLSGPGTSSAVYFADASSERKAMVGYDGAEGEMVIGATAAATDTVIRTGSEPEALRLPNVGPAAFARGVTATNLTVDGPWLRIKDSTVVDNHPTTGTLGYGGQIRWDETYLYICTASSGQTRGDWKRIQLSSWS